MAQLAMSRSHSDEIAPASRLGAALGMLAGCTAMEARRVHDQQYICSNLHRAVKAINECPALEIDPEVD